jgi:hypothetical protein
MTLLAYGLCQLAAGPGWWAWRRYQITARLRTWHE